MPCEPGCIGLAASGGLVAALRDGFYRLDTQSGVLRKVADAPPPPYDPATMRFNDGRCDAAGRFWAGAMFEPRTAEAAGVFVLERGQVREGWGPAQGAGVKVSNLIESEAPGRRVYEPNHPSADGEGYVNHSNVNAVEEMVNMISASRSYQNNVEVMNTAKSLLLKTLQIGQ